MARFIFFAVLLLVGGAACYWAFAPRSLPRSAFDRLYDTPLPRLEAPPAVYHLGHLLVGRDMPAILAQMTGGSYALQLGWGASLQQHWQGQVPGFAEENASPAVRPAREAVGSGDYGAVVLTEMTELKDALRYHKSARALADWADLARAASPDVRIYLYETWHRPDDPAVWEARVAQDRRALWEDQLLRPAMARGGVGTFHVIPGGTVLAAVVAAAEAGSIPGVTDRRDLFSDGIHLTDLGAYLIALTHYAMITGQSPVGLPAPLASADGAEIDLTQFKALAILQTLVWMVVQSDPMTGVAGPT